MKPATAGKNNGRKYWGGETEVAGSRNQEASPTPNTDALTVSR